MVNAVQAYPGQEPVQLEKLDGGGLNDRFQIEFAKVIENIYDPNASAKAKRKITIELVIDPDDDRFGCSLMYRVTSKLAPTLGGGVRLFTGIKGGRYMATEAKNPNQMEMWKPVVPAAPAPVADAAAPSTPTAQEGQQP